MNKTAPEPQAPAVAETADTTPTPEDRNVAVTVLQNRTKIGKAIVAAGRCDFPLTMTEAKALEALGKVRIEGLF